MQKIFCGIMSIRIVTVGHSFKVKTFYSKDDDFEQRF